MATTTRKAPASKAKAAKPAPADDAAADEAADAVEAEAEAAKADAEVADDTEVAEEAPVEDEAVPGEAAQVADADDQADGEVVIGLGEFFRRLYAVTYSKTLGLIIILVFAVFVLLGVIFSQAPTGTWPDATARANFLTEMTSKYGSATNVLSALGIFHIFSSIGFYVVTIALVISIIGCTTHRIPVLWKRWRYPGASVSRAFFDAARYRGQVTTGLAADAGLAKASKALKAARYRVVELPENSLFVDRFAWGGFGTVVAHLSFIVILAAFLVSGLASFSVLLNAPIGGNPVAVGDSTNLTVAVTDYNETYDDATGQPTDYVSHVIVYDNGQAVKEQDVRVNSPLTYGKWTFYQYSGLGMAYDVTVTSADGSTLYDGSVPQQYQSNDGTLSVGLIRLDSLGVDIQVEGPASGQVGINNTFGLQPGQVGFVIWVDGATQPDNMTDLTLPDSGPPAAAVDPGGSYIHKDLTLTFNRESQYTGIKARTDPGTILVWIGGLLLVIGMTVTFTFRYRRVWVRAEGKQLLLASADKEDSGFRQNFTELVEQAQTWYSGEHEKASTRKGDN
ncbi:MAG: cytochrome c biogenesis protein ResB [Propionibacteriaceae bacterium]|nr:cytochrome c biogenesis protein ResB [Propionibacteriaceae bacterium]